MERCGSGEGGGRPEPAKSTAASQRALLRSATARSFSRSALSFRRSEASLFLSKSVQTEKRHRLIAQNRLDARFPSRTEIDGGNGDKDVNPIWRLAE